MKRRLRLLYVVNEAYFFMSHRLPIARAALAAGFDVHVAAPSDHVWAPKGFSIDDLRAEGFQFHPIPLSRRGKHPIRELKTIYGLYRLYRALRPDIVHHITIKPSLYGGLVARLVGVPAVICAITGLGDAFIASGPAAFILRRLVLLGYRLALAHPNARVIVQNPDDGEMLRSARAAKSESLVLIYGSGVALDQFVPTEEPDDVPTVIMPARLIWDKGVGEFAAAARILRQSGVSARFVLLGDTRPSNPRAVPLSVLRDWETEGIVEWWGRREDMPTIYAASHIVCLPSSYGEGVPKVLIEAAAAGRPAVSTDTPGCRDIVKNMENGLLVRPKDPHELAKALSRLIEDRDLRRRMGRRGREIAETVFSDEEVVRRTMEVYQAVLGNCGLEGALRTPEIVAKDVV